MLQIALDTEFGRRFVQTISDGAKYEGIPTGEYLKFACHQLK